MVSSTDFVRASERTTAIATLNRQRHLTPSCGGFTPTAERTVGPARMIVESLTARPGIREHNRRKAAVGDCRQISPPDNLATPHTTRSTTRSRTLETRPANGTQRGQINAHKGATSFLLFIRISARLMVAKTRFGHRGITRLRMDSVAVLRRKSLGCRRSYCVCSVVPAIVSGNAADWQRSRRS